MPKTKNLIICNHHNSISQLKFLNELLHSNNVDMLISEFPYVEHSVAAENFRLTKTKEWQSKCPKIIHDFNIQIAAEEFFQREVMETVEIKGTKVAYLRNQEEIVEGIENICGAGEFAAFVEQSGIKHLVEDITYLRKNSFKKACNYGEEINHDIDCLQIWQKFIDKLLLVSKESVSYQYIKYSIPHIFNNCSNIFTGNETSIYKIIKQQIAKTAQQNNIDFEKISCLSELLNKGSKIEGVISNIMDKLKSLSDNKILNALHTPLKKYLDKHEAEEDLQEFTESVANFFHSFKVKADSFMVSAALVNILHDQSMFDKMTQSLQSLNVKSAVTIVGAAHCQSWLVKDTPSDLEIFYLSPVDMNEDYSDLIVNYDVGRICFLDYSNDQCLEQANKFWLNEQNLESKEEL